MSKLKTPARCPHCGKCVGIAAAFDEYVLLAVHKGNPPKRANAVQAFMERRCGHSECRRDFVVECYIPFAEILRQLIFNDPTALAREIFKNNTDLVEKLREDKEFMALINNTAG